MQVLQDLFYVLLHVLFYLWSLLKSDLPSSSSSSSSSLMFPHCFYSVSYFIHLLLWWLCEYTFIVQSIGVGNGRAGGTCPPAQKIGKIFLWQLLRKIRAFSSNNHVKFGKFANFFDKNHVKFGHFVNFSYILFGQKVSCPPKVDWAPTHMVQSNAENVSLVQSENIIQIG